MSKYQINGWIKMISAILGFLVLFAAIIKAWQVNIDEHKSYEYAFKIIKSEGSDLSKQNDKDIIQINTKLDRILTDIEKIDKKLSGTF